MDISQIKERVKSYDFLKSNPHLGSNIILLGLGGSHAYGTETGTSDLDVRGCALNTEKEILGSANFEQFCNEETDTVIYSFNKLVSLLSNCNPNVIELLGLKPEHYLYIAPIGRELLDNADMFLSKRAFYSFGGYATAQLRRLENAGAKTMEQGRREEHILGSIKNAAATFPEKYFSCPEDAIRLYTGKSEREEYDTEIFMDVSLTRYPLRDYKCMWSEMNNIVKDYAKVGKRNKTAIEKGKLGKHMMHLVRLYMMGLDILREGRVVTYREKEHDLLMSIRNGKYLGADGLPVPEFYEMVNRLEKEMEKAKAESDLPDNPNYARIEEFRIDVNRRVVAGKI